MVNVLEEIGIELSKVGIGSREANAIIATDALTELLAIYKVLIDQRYGQDGKWRNYLPDHLAYMSEYDREVLLDQGDWVAWADDRVEFLAKKAARYIESARGLIHVTSNEDEAIRYGNMTKDDRRKERHYWSTEICPCCGQEIP